MLKKKVFKEQKWGKKILKKILKNEFWNNISKNNLLLLC